MDRAARIGTREARIPVDLLVPEASVAPGGRCGARLGPHGNQAARKLTRLEAALVDNVPMTPKTLDQRDQRSVTVLVAEIAALMIGKAHKLMTVHMAAVPIV